LTFRSQGTLTFIDASPGIQYFSSWKVARQSIGGFLGSESRTAIGRREFARHVAISAAVTLVPSRAFAESAAIDQSQQPEAQKFSSEGQSEADARYQTILALYGSRFSDAQKADLRRLSLDAQTVLGHVRAARLANSDSPALYLKPLLEREKQPGSAAAAPAAVRPKA
jgi:hypothetical protein